MNNINDLLEEFVDALISYIDQLREVWHINQPQDISIERIEQDDRTYFIFIRITPNTSNWFSLSHWIDNNFNAIVSNNILLYEEDLYHLLRRLKYNISVLKVILMPPLIFLNFRLNPYKSLILNFEILQEIGYYLPANDIKHLCLSHKTFNESICQSDIFWYKKSIFDFGSKLPFIPDALIMKQMYLDYGKLAIMGYKFLPVVQSMKVKMMSVNGHHNLFIDQDNRLWHIKHDYDKIPRLTKTEVRYPHVNPINNPQVKLLASTEGHSFIVDRDDYLWDYDQRNNNIELITNKLKVISLACFRFVALIVDSNYELWGIVRHVAAGVIDISLFDKIVTVDRNLRKIELPFKVKNVSCQDEIFIVTELDNTLWYMVSYWISPQLTPPIKLEMKGKFVVSSHEHTMIIDVDGQLWGLGRNDSGQLGLGHYDNIILPVKVYLDIKIKMIACGVPS